MKRKQWLNSPYLTVLTDRFDWWIESAEQHREWRWFFSRLGTMVLIGSLSAFVTNLIIHYFWPSLAKPVPVASSLWESRRVSTLRSICAVGDDLDKAGNNTGWYLCLSPNTWTALPKDSVLLNKVETRFQWYFYYTDRRDGKLAMITLVINK